jgi:hypothetical protein
MAVTRKRNHHNIKSHKKHKSSSRKHSKKTHYKKKHTNRKYKKHSKSRYQKQKGGNCQIASVREPSINIPATGSISGLSIADSRAAIYRPDCNIDTNQAMVP